MSTSKSRPYHHGNLRESLIAAARALLDAGGPAAVGLRETARRVGVSPTATYRHFADKEALLAALAAEGFHDLADRQEAARREADPLPAMGRAYVAFALERRGLFRLMFGPDLTDRGKYPELKEAADRSFHVYQGGVHPGAAPQPVDIAAIAAWALVHGLALLFLDGVLPEAHAAELTRAITGSRGLLEAAVAESAGGRPAKGGDPGQPAAPRRPAGGTAS
jgi:AcrR family transcriptional regulator